MEGIAEIVHALLLTEILPVILVVLGELLLTRHVRLGHGLLCGSILVMVLELVTVIPALLHGLLLLLALGQRLGLLHAYRLLLFKIIGRCRCGYILLINLGQRNLNGLALTGTSATFVVLTVVGWLFLDRFCLRCGL